MTPIRLETTLACLLVVSSGLGQRAGHDATKLFQAHGKKIEEALNSHSAAFFAHNMDAKEFAAKVAEGIAAEKSAIQQMQSQLGFVSGSAIVKLADGRAKLMRVTSVETRARAIFRLLRGDGALDYLVFDLRDDSGKVHVTDMHTTRGGEPLSQMIQRSFSNSLFGSSRKQWKVLEFSRLVALGKNDEALKAFDDLDSAAQHRREVLYQRLTAAWHIGREAVEAAAKDIARYVPETEPSRALQMHYVYSATGDLEKALACLDVLDKWTGDPFLDVERAQTLMQAGEAERARVSAKRAIDREPELIHGYLLHIEATLRSRKHAATVEMLQAMEKKHEIPLQVVCEFEGFDVFRVSDVGRAWYDAHRARKTPGKPDKR